MFGLLVGCDDDDDVVDDDDCDDDAHSDKDNDEFVSSVVLS